MTFNNDLKERLNEHYIDKINRLVILTPNKGNEKLMQYKIEMEHSNYGSVHLLIEYDKSKPEYGIYFGCKCKDPSENQNAWMI